MNRNVIVVLGGVVAAFALVVSLGEREASAAGIAGVLDAVEGRAALIQRSDAMANLVAEASPAVVNISVSRQGSDAAMWPFGTQPRTSPDQRTRVGAGSGVVIDSEGLIVTNHHVVRDAAALEVSFADGREFPAEVVGSDPATDIALIRVDAPGERFHALQLAPAAARPGETVVAIGNPFGLSSSVSTGIVSAVGRDRTGLTDFGDFIQTDAAINPGNSGGALINARGELLGINTAIYSRSGGSQGIGFAIPSSLVTEIVAVLQTDGRVSRGWLGVSISDAENGVRMEYVEPNGPGGLAGLRAGNIVREVGGAPVADAQQLRERIAGYPAGAVVGLVIDGKDAPIALDVTLGERPAPDELRGFGLQMPAPR